MNKIQMANDGYMRSQNITAEEINNHAMESLKVSESAQEFWRDFVTEKSWVMNSQKASFYLRNYIE